MRRSFVCIFILSYIVCAGQIPLHLYLRFSRRRRKEDRAGNDSCPV